MTRSNSTYFDRAEIAHGIDEGPRLAKCLRENEKRWKMTNYEKAKREAEEISANAEQCSEEIVVLANVFLKLVSQLEIAREAFGDIADHPGPNASYEAFVRADIASAALQKMEAANA